MGNARFHFGALILQIPTVDVKLAYVCLFYLKGTADY